MFLQPLHSMKALISSVLPHQAQVFEESLTWMLLLSLDEPVVLKRASP